MPFSRWDVDEYYDPAMPTGLEMYVRHAAFVENVEFFDAQLFGITKVEAEAMDPQQRHLLETAYGAFMDGGWKKAHLMGKTAGVFVGQDKCDWNRMISAAHAGPFAATGGSASISSNRISYSLGLKGPSATVDTACSSSLVAADTAAMNIRQRRCDFAVICGVNMLLLPQTFIGCCRARMLSSDGRCHTFDSSASGYARGEGCGAQVLQNLDVIGPNLSKFLGSALNQDGRSANLTSPNGPSQELVVKMALEDAQITSQHLHQVETHGTGTELGDPIETGALRSVLRRDGDGDPVRLGAVKSNVGHLEGGAGMAGLSKLVREPRISMGMEVGSPLMGEDLRLWHFFLDIQHCQSGLRFTWFWSILIILDISHHFSSSFSCQLFGRQWYWVTPGIEGHAATAEVGQRGQSPPASAESTHLGGSPLGSFSWGKFMDMDHFHSSWSLTFFGEAKCSQH